MDEMPLLFHVNGNFVPVLGRAVSPFDLKSGIFSRKKQHKTSVELGFKRGLKINIVHILESISFKDEEISDRPVKILELYTRDKIKVTK